MSKLFKQIIFSVLVIIVFLVMSTTTVSATEENARYIMDAETMSDGKIAVLFVKGGTSSSGIVTGGKLYLGVYNPTNNGWEEAFVGTSESVAKEASLALFNNKAYVAYITSSDTIAYTHQLTSGWSEEEIITSNNCNNKQGTLSTPDIAVDVNGKAYISYTDSDGAQDADFSRADGMYATNTSGSWVKAVVANCTGYRDSGSEYTTLSNPVKVALSDSNYQIAYKILSFSSNMWGDRYSDYSFEFVSTTNSSRGTNNGGKIYEMCSDGTNYYTLVSENGKFIVLSGNANIDATIKANSASVADMTLSNSNIYYATINGNSVLFYQNGTFVEDKMLTTSILSSHNKMATVISSGVQYILYTGSDEDNSLVINKLSDDTLTEFLVPNGPQMFDVTFITNDGSAVDPQTIEEGSYAVRPVNDPVKENWTFDDWYTDNTYTEKFNFSTMAITEDTEIYARFGYFLGVYTGNETEGLIKLDDENDLVNSRTLICDSGDEHNLYAEPNDGYRFVRWVKRVSNDPTSDIISTSDENPLVYTSTGISYYFAEFEAIPYDLWIGDTRVTGANAGAVLGDNKIQYNATTNTLTLNGATITGGGNEDIGWGIKYLGDSDFNIVASGTNVVSDSGTRKEGSAGLTVSGEPGIYTGTSVNVNVNITVNENSTLTFNGGAVTGVNLPVSYGILLSENEGNLTIGGAGIFNALGNDMATYSYGVISDGAIIINNTGTVNVRGGSGVYYSLGMYGSDITINSGTVNITGGNADESYGLSTEGASYKSKGDIIINGGSVLATAGVATTNSYGTISDKSIQVTAGSFESVTNAIEGTKAAVNMVPTIANGMIAAGSVNSNSTGFVVYNESDNATYNHYLVPVTTCIVSFETNGGTAVPEQIIVTGEKAARPAENPQKDKHTFVGWYKNSGLTEEFIFNNEIINSNITIYAKYEEIHEHTLVKTEAKAATCIAQGNNEYYTCSGCQQVFKNKEGTVKTTVEAETLAIDPSAHDWNDGVITTSATCLTEGVKLYTCKHNSSHTREEVVSKLAHALVYVGAVPAKCDEEGNIEYYKCSSCDKYFRDGTGTVEITDKSSVIISAKGHNWGEWKVTTAATEDSEGEKIRTCINDASHIERRVIPKLTDAIEIVKVDEVLATCTSPGTREYWINPVTNQMYSDSEGLVEIDAPEVIAKLAHNWNEGVITTEATCESDGVKTYTCLECNETKTEVIAKKGHKLEFVEAVKATCDNNGIKAHYRCSECGKLFSDSSGNVQINEEEAIIEKLPLEIIDGENSTYTGKDLVVKTNGKFSEFLKLLLDKKVVDPKYYILEEGSTIVTLKSEYLATLPKGDHILTFVYSDGSTIDTGLAIAEVNNNEEEIKGDASEGTPMSGGEENKEEQNGESLKTEKTSNVTEPSKEINKESKKSSVPDTGDDIIVWISLMFVSILGIIGIITFVKKKK